MITLRQKGSPGSPHRRPDLGYGVWAGGAGRYHGGQLPDGEDSMITPVDAFGGEALPLTT